MQDDTILSQPVLNFLIYFLLINIQIHIIHADNGIGQSQGKEFDIIPPYIKRPADIVQGCQQMHRGSLLLHHRSDALKFAGRRFPRIFFLQYEYRLF